jgi:uncharacterized GH25 family protein
VRTCWKRNAALALVAWAASLSALGHEFWIETSPPAPVPGQAVLMTLRVGQQYSGELVGITTAHALSLHAWSAGKDEDLGSRVPGTSMLPALRLTFAAAGSHVLAYESLPSQVVLDAAKFHDYLHDEGMDWVIRQREAAGTAATPGRERFRRSAKALVEVGGQADGASTLVTGQRMEITPLEDPLAHAAGDRLDFVLRFEGRPRPGVLVKAWHKQDGTVTTLRATTDAEGRFSFTPPVPGRWMLNAVHMVPATDSPDVDWDSFWGSLSFDLLPRKD